MGKITGYSRLSHHTISGTGSSGLTFSVPSSEDFTDGSWTNFDLALSEIGVNEQDKRVYIRIDDEIKEFQLVGSTSSGDTLAQVLSNGNTTGGTNITLSNNDKIVGETQLILSTTYSINNDFYLGNADSIVYGNSEISTDDNTVTTIKLISYASKEDSVITIEAVVNGRDISTGDAYGSKLFATFKNVGGVTSLIGTVDKTEKTDFSTATSNIEISSNDIIITVTGELSTDINWVTRYDYQISY